MSEFKKKTLKDMKTSVSVSPLETSFEVTVPGADLWNKDFFKFSISSDGSVIINDNYFNGKEQAVKVLEAMTAFLKK